MNFLNALNKVEEKKLFDKKENIIKLSKNTKLLSDKKTRFYILDNFKGILIFTVVFGHFLFRYSEIYINSLSCKIVNYIYSFHMPSFIFISGFLSKSDNSRNYKSINRLFLIYIIFNFSHGFILYKYKNLKIKFMDPYHSYWYLLCLIYWRISIKFLSNQYFSIIISFILSILIGFSDDISSVFSIKRAFTFFPYFLTGYKLSKNYFEKIISLRKKFYIFSLLLFFIFIYISLKIFPFVETKHSMMLNNYKNYINDIKIRISLFVFSLLMILFNILLIPNSKIVLITNFGKNSLFIYLFHRIFTIIIDDKVFSQLKYEKYIIQFSFLFTIIILLIFSSDIFAKYINIFINYIYENLINNNINGKILVSFFFCFFIKLLLIKAFLIINLEKEKEQVFIKNSSLSIKLINNFNFENAIKISYVGDLLLLKDQVIYAKNKYTGKYEFDEIFHFTSDHFKKSDLTIGVYEGPSAGNKFKYSTSNIGDGIPLYLNFPDEFAESVKRAGINLVTLANNHILDRNIEGAFRTIDILNKYNITHTGAYKYKTKKNLLLLNINGIKFAILSYTSIINIWNLEKLYKNYQYITNLVPFTKNKYYSKIYQSIQEDFQNAKNSNADYIMVLVHMGSQFKHQTNSFQKKWNKIFSGLGADFILGAHAQAVQPLEILDKTFIVNCPGNFVNSFRKYDGDATSIVDLYFDKENKKFIGSSIVPMFIQEYKPKVFRVLPIFNIFNESLKLSEKDKNRVKIIQKIITKVMVRKKIPISEIKKEYFFINGSYVDISNNSSKLYKKVKKEYTNKKLYKLLDNSYSIAFIGDSITEGTKNNFHPWYEPLIYCFKNKKIINISGGSYASLLMVQDYKYSILKSKSDLYIIAIGNNDIRYRNPKKCAMTKEDYIKNIKKIVMLARKSNKKSKIVLIAPWLSNSNDINSKLNKKEKNKLLEEYTQSLQNYCIKNDFLFINPNHYIKNIISQNSSKYLLDYINPNENNGILLYSEAVLKNSI